MPNPRVPQEMIDSAKYVIRERMARRIDSEPRSQERIFLAWTRLSKFKDLVEDSINAELKDINGNGK